MSEFPKWLYHAHKPAVVVDDADAEEDLGEGWFDTPAEAKESVQDDDEDESEAHRKELLAKAKSLGLNLHHKTGADKIQAAIDAKEDE